MKKAILPAAAALLLAACSGNDNDISESGLKKGIEKFAEKQGMCIPMPLHILDTAGQPIANAAIGSPKLLVTNRDSEGKRINKEAEEQMEILVDEGIYAEEDKRTAEKNDAVVKTMVYGLTEKGAALLQYGPRGPVVCAGKVKVEKINWFTDPTPSNGMTVSKVSYQAELDPEKWMKKLINTNDAWKKFSEEQEYSTTMVKTNNGWKDIRELR